ncbi:MAG: alpha/beta hydrolase [Chloroflexi bacterium]|nr:alpha/beta hydrolase [Chloroflexota bacterium]
MAPRGVADRRLHVGRVDITFDSGGQQVAGWFYAPDGAGPEPWSCVVMGHGFAAVKEARLDAFAERFAEAGLACLVFDYRHFGASGGQPRQVINIRKQQEDWRAAIAYARTRSDVDRGRVALWGTSFGGGHVLDVAKKDHGIAAAVLHLPLVDSLAAAKGEGLGQSLRLGLAGLRDELRRLLRRPPHLIPVVGPPGTLAVMTTPEAEPGYLSIVRDAPSWQNTVAARIALEMALFRPGRKTASVSCPSLFVVGMHDTVTPPEATLRTALRTPGARLMGLPTGHFDAYLGDAFEEAVTAEAAFLVQHLAPAGRRAAGSASEAIPAAWSRGA